MTPSRFGKATATHAIHNRMDLVDVGHGIVLSASRQIAGIGAVSPSME
jgi:hypothetical protein